MKANNIIITYPDTLYVPGDNFLMSRPLQRIITIELEGTGKEFKFPPGEPPKQICRLGYTISRLELNKTFNLDVKLDESLITWLLKQKVIDACTAQLMREELKGISAFRCRMKNRVE